MTKQDAIDWISGNLPTQAGGTVTHPITGDEISLPDDAEAVVVFHDTGDGSDCSICGRPHDPSVESIPVDDLAELYHEDMDSKLPDPASDVAQAAIDAARSAGMRHERFFELM